MMHRCRKLLSCATIGLLLSLSSVAVEQASETTPEWAVPKEGPPQPLAAKEGKIAVSGSELALTREEIDNPFDTPDWFPGEHDPMPRIVKHGNAPDNWACAMCHLASGNGHPQSAKLAGNSADYLMRQLAAFAAGDRSSYLGAFIDDLHVIENREDARAAAEWFASLPPTPHQTVVETDTVPETAYYGTSFMRTVKTGNGGAAGREPIAGRIIEVPEDYQAVKARSPRGSFVTYVPEGSVASGQKIALQGAGSMAPCISCHGPELRGTVLGPALAGVFPTYIVRQIYDFRSGGRRGLADQTGYMSSSSRSLSPEDIVNVAAYIGSLSP